MKQFTITVSEEEEKALLIYMTDIQEWIDNAIHNRARQAIDQIVSENSDKQPKKLSAESRAILINEITPNLKTALQRNEDELQKLKNKVI